MSAHTPGPWKAEPCTNGFRAPDENDFQIVAANLICPGTVWGGPVFKEGEANARLIAAAPCMLALLRDMRNAPDPYDGVGGWWEEIDDAIAKATGST